MEKEDYNQWFRNPVESSFTVPDYRKLISHPMDFSTMRANVRRNAYETLDALREHLVLIFDNSITYNTPASSYGQEAQRLRMIAEQKVSNAKVLMEAIEKEQARMDAAAETVLASLSDPYRDQKLAQLRSRLIKPQNPPIRPSQHHTQPAFEGARPQPGAAAGDSTSAAGVESGQLAIPELLVQHLLKERDEYMFEGKTRVRLPKAVTVARILDQFEAKALAHSTIPEEGKAEVREIVSGLRANFSDACIKCLMYPSETTAMREALRLRAGASPDKPWETIFGAEHLLRLVVHLPDKLRVARLAPERLSFVLRTLNQLLVFLSLNYAYYFDQ
eukprot:RCo014562